MCMGRAAVVDSGGCARREFTVEYQLGSLLGGLRFGIVIVCTVKFENWQ